MPVYAKIRTDVVIMEPISGALVGHDNAMFIDSDNSNTLSNKQSNVTTAVSSGSLFMKQMQSGLVGFIPAKTPVSKLSNGKITPATANQIANQEFIGITIDSFAGLDSLGTVLLVGPNASGAITGLGFAPGEDVYVSPTGGYTNDSNTLTAELNSFIRVGKADCGAGTASAIATDLVLFPQVMAKI